MKRKKLSDAEVILNAIKSVTPVASDVEIEGNRAGWHMRLVQRIPLNAEQQAAYAAIGENITAIETWQLFRGDEPQSSPTSKDTVYEWLREELGMSVSAFAAQFPRWETK